MGEERCILERKGRRFEMVVMVVVKKLGRSFEEGFHSRNSIAAVVAAAEVIVEESIGSSS